MKGRRKSPPGRLYAGAARRSRGQCQVRATRPWVDRRLWAGLGFYRAYEQCPPKKLTLDLQILGSRFFTVASYFCRAAMGWMLSEPFFGCPPVKRLVMVPV